MIYIKLNAFISGLDQLDFVKGQKLKLYNRHENGNKLEMFQVSQLKLLY